MEQLQMGLNAMKPKTATETTDTTPETTETQTLTPSTIDIADNVIPDGYRAIAFRRCVTGEIIISPDGEVLESTSDGQYPRLILEREEPAEFTMLVRTGWLKGWASSTDTGPEMTELRERSQALLTEAGITWA